VRGRGFGRAADTVRLAAVQWLLHGPPSVAPEAGEMITGWGWKNSFGAGRADPSRRDTASLTTE
jgi:hypothetical protein